MPPAFRPFPDATPSATSMPDATSAPTPPSASKARAASASPSASKARAASASPKSAFMRFVRFETMLTPILIRLVFYVGSVLLILAGIVAIYSGATARYGGGAQVLGGLGMLFFGPFLLRIVCEQILVLFGIFERLGEIRDQGA